ncbi:hypothetical protein E2C01_079912 [Portunus trituberculatus]|uniref:Uncharacterized protein n=1 Tax=Portunus trituberculatus TaxID=210409 RepID=A0A5B7IKR9_PORTR|nr:hypothetical protein [Portunus trituberculatus]
MLLLQRGLALISYASFTPRHPITPARSHCLATSTSHGVTLLTHCYVISTHAIPATSPQNHIPLHHYSPYHITFRPVF